MSLTNFQYFTSAYGGFTYDCNGYRIHKFNQSGILTITNIGLVDVLVVGGGAGGGVNAGGGAGGVIYQSNIPVQLGQINITVGDGGYAYPDTTNGTSSSFSNIILAGGGNIGADLYQGGISGTPQSYPGNSVSIPYGGGGGGASGLITINNNGIYGLSNSISGDFQYYGGGGGGCGCNLLYQGIGGLGGGGRRRRGRRDGGGEPAGERAARARGGRRPVRGRPPRRGQRQGAARGDRRPGHRDERRPTAGLRRSRLQVCGQPGAAAASGRAGAQAGRTLPARRHYAVGDHAGDGHRQRGLRAGLWQ